MVNKAMEYEKMNREANEGGVPPPDSSPPGDSLPTYDEALSRVRTDPPTDGLRVEEECKAIRTNICLLFISLLLLLMCFNAINNVESTLNPSAGFTSLACMYGTMIVMGFFMSNWIISKISVRSGIFYGMTAYTIYGLGQFSPSPTVLIVMGIVLGVGASLLWISFSTYLFYAGRRLAELTNKDQEVVLGQLFAMAYLFYSLSFVGAGAISATVLYIGSGYPNLTQVSNATCGVDFCPSDVVETDISVMSPMDPTNVRIYVIVLSAVSIFAAYLSGRISDSLTKFDAVDDTEDTLQSRFGVVRSTIMTFLNPRLSFLGALMLWMGAAQSFIIGDFNVAYVSCLYGMKLTHYIVLVFPLGGVIGSLGVIFLLNIRGRIPVMSLGGIVTITALGLMVFGSGYVGQTFLLILIPSLWGISNAVWHSQVKALVGVVFYDRPKEAFSVFSVLQSLGFVVNYAVQPFMCMVSKLVVLLVVIILGLTGYFLLEGIVYLDKKRKTSVIGN